MTLCHQVKFIYILNRQSFISMIELQIYRFMKDIETDLPGRSDTCIVARIRRWQYFSTREDFNIAWREHEHILTHYEDKVKKILQNQARLGVFQIQTKIYNGLPERQLLFPALLLTVLGWLQSQLEILCGALKDHKRKCGSFLLYKGNLLA